MLASKKTYEVLAISLMVTFVSLLLTMLLGIVSAYTHLLLLDEITVRVGSAICIIISAIFFFIPENSETRLRWLIPIGDGLVLIGWIFAHTSFGLNTYSIIAIVIYVLGIILWFFGMGSSLKEFPRFWKSYKALKQSNTR